MVRLRRTGLVIAATGACVAGSAQAGDFKINAFDNKTRVHIEGKADDQFAIMDSKGNILDKGTANEAGLKNFGPFPDSPGPYTVRNLTETDKADQTTDVLTPGQNVAVSNYLIDPNSSISNGSATVILKGSFTTIDTQIDYDPFSPTFGEEIGFVSDLNIHGSGDFGAMSFILNSSPMYSLNLSSAWALPDTAIQASVPISENFSGTLVFNASSSPFTGTFSGIDTFLQDGSTLASGQILFDTAFGTFSGHITASASPTLRAIPEPSTWTLLVGGFALLGVTLRSHRRAAFRRP